MKHNNSSLFSSTTISFFRNFSVCCLIFCSARTQAQLIVTTPVTSQQVVTKLLGCNSSASNITMTSCGTSVGFFNAVNTNLGIDSGILFSSGDANLAAGQNNNCCQGTDNGCGGNALLQSLCGQMTFNAAVLDFD